MCVYKKACTRHPRTAGGHFPLGLAKRNTRNTFDGGKCMLRTVSSKAAAATMASCCDVNASGIFDETLAQRSPRLSCHASRGTSVSEERESDRTVTNGFRSSRRRALIGLRTYYVCTLCKWIPIEGRSTEEKQLSKTKHIYGVFSIEMLVLLDVVRLSSVGFELVKLHRMGLYHTSFHRNLAKSQRYGPIDPTKAPEAKHWTSLQQRYTGERNRSSWRRREGEAPLFYADPFLCVPDVGFVPIRVSRVTRNSHKNGFPLSPTRGVGSTACSEYSHVPLADALIGSLGP